MATTKPRIYLDSCAFIDAVKHETGESLSPERSNDAWYIRSILRAHAAKDVEAFTSQITAGECVAIRMGQDVVPQEVQDRFRNLISSGQYVSLVSPTPKTTELVQQFRWSHNLVLKGADAFHFAAAIERGCQEFITTDDRLTAEKIRKAAPVLSGLGLSMIHASQSALLPEAYRKGLLDG